MPTTYAQFGVVYKTNATAVPTTQPSVVTEDNVIILRDNSDAKSDPQSDTMPKRSLPYVEMMLAGFFFVVYFVDQVLQVKHIELEFQIYHFMLVYFQLHWKSQFKESKPT